MSSQNPGQPAPGYQQPQQPPKKKHGCLWTAIIAVVVIIVVVIAAVSCMAKGASDAVDAVDSATSAQHKVVYKVTTDGPATVNYGSTSGNSSEDIKAGNWSKTETITGLDGMSVSVTATGESSTKVSCTLTVDGKVKAQKSGSGVGASADCAAGSN